MKNEKKKSSEENWGWRLFTRTANFTDISKKSIEKQGNLDFLSWMRLLLILLKSLMGGMRSTNREYTSLMSITILKSFSILYFRKYSRWKWFEKLQRRKLGKKNNLRCWPEKRKRTIIQAWQQQPLIKRAII